jgi:hypothetical protein
VEKIIQQAETGLIKEATEATVVNIEMLHKQHSTRFLLLIVVVFVFVVLAIVALAIGLATFLTNDAHTDIGTMNDEGFIVQATLDASDPTNRVWTNVTRDVSAIWWSVLQIFLSCLSQCFGALTKSCLMLFVLVRLIPRQKKV